MFFTAENGVELTMIILTLTIDIFDIR